MAKAIICFVMPVRPSVFPPGATRLPLDGFSWKLILKNFSKFNQENWSLNKIGQKYPVVYMETNMQFWSYLVQFFFRKEMFQPNFVEKMKTCILGSITFFFFENRTIHVKICTDFSAVRATDDKIAHEHGIVDTLDNKHTISISNIYCFYTKKMITRTRLKCTLYYLHCLCW